MAKVTRIKYFTEERNALVNPKNREIYKKYLSSCITKDKSVKETTYLVYENYFNQFLVYLSEEWNNVDLLSKDFFDSAIDIIEGYMQFLQDVLMNNKKVINTKISAVSSFYLWCVKRRLVEYHPFDKKVTRMQGANDERITKDYFLTQEQVDYIASYLETCEDYDIQHKILFHLAVDSGNRVGAISKLTLTSLNMEEMMFEDIREKRGKRVEVIFDKKCAEYIKQWLEMRKELDNLQIDALFITKYNSEFRPMAYGTLQDRAKELGKIIGIEDFHMHCFRKTAANLLMNETNDIMIAKEFLNHKSTEVTGLYLKPKSKTEIRDKRNEFKQKKREKELKEIEND